MRPKSFVVLTAWLLVFPNVGLSGSIFKEENLYGGDLYTYEKAESYKSIFEGRVYLLEPTGYDVFKESGRAVLVEGVISRETTRTVTNILDRISDVQGIYFDSPGGDLFAGLDLGRRIAAAEYQTVVNTGAECASACALAFLGGRHRKIVDPSRFGFHRQFYIRNNQIEYGSWKEDHATIDKYLRDVQATGIQADEVVGTTGLVTYSERRLLDRQIATATKSGLLKHIKKELDFTGATVAERYAAFCARNYCAKTGVVPVFRLPMLLHHYANNNDHLMTEDELLEFRSLLPERVIRHSQLARIDCHLMGGEYLNWLTSRYEIFASRQLAAKASRSVLESFHGVYERAHKECSAYLKESESSAVKSESARESKPSRRNAAQQRAPAGLPLRGRP